MTLHGDLDCVNHFSLAFYKVASGWLCRNHPKLTWPEGLTDWPKSEYEGGKNNRDEKAIIKLAARRTLRRSMQLPNVRSNSTLWSLGNDRDTYRTPHEFGHLLGASDEYKKAGTKQFGVKDGVDTNGIMGSGGPGKKRPYKGTLLAMARCAKSVSTRDFSYIAVPTGPTLALDPSMPKLSDQGPSPTIQQMIEPEPKPVVNVAAVAGGIKIGTALGYFASDKNGAWAAGDLAVRSRPIHGSKPPLPTAATFFNVQ